MNTKKALFFGIVLLTAILIAVFVYLKLYPGDPIIVSVKFNSKKVNISLYLKDKNGKTYGNIGNLKSALSHKNSKLIFASNGGMFDESYQPIGLYIENGQIIKPLNTKTIIPDKNNTIPNFYLQPNGVFYITTTNEAGICQTSDFPLKSNIKYATQSGPMLLIDGKINKIFDPKSRNYNIRNGVGIRPDKDIIFAISLNNVTFYDLAKYFKDQGCTQALFFDGYVSKAFIPQKEVIQMDGNLGVLIGITEKD